MDSESGIAASLVAGWRLRRVLYEAGISATNAREPLGDIAEALTFLALHDGATVDQLAASRTEAARLTHRRADLAIPWEVLFQAIPDLRQHTPVHGAEGAPARIQVKARYAPDSPRHIAYDAVYFSYVRGEEPEWGNDLFSLVMFGQLDEFEQGLEERNFVLTAVLITSKLLASLDNGAKSGRLDWTTIHRWYDDGLPAGALDLTDAYRRVALPGWGG